MSREHGTWKEESIFRCDNSVWKRISPIGTGEEKRKMPEQKASSAFSHPVTLSSRSVKELSLWLLLMLKPWIRDRTRGDVPDPHTSFLTPLPFHPHRVLIHAFTHSSPTRLTLLEIHKRLNNNAIIRIVDPKP